MSRKLKEIEVLPDQQTAENLLGRSLTGEQLRQLGVVRGDPAGLVGRER
jgi:hypothetical protein